MIGSTKELDDEQQWAHGRNAKRLRKTWRQVHEESAPLLLAVAHNALTACIIDLAGYPSIRSVVLRWWAHALPTRTSIWRNSVKTARQGAGRAALATSILEVGDGWTDDTVFWGTCPLPFQ